MKSILLIVSVIFTITSICNAAFEDYFDADYLNSDYNDACFLGNSEILICGGYGVILKTTDMGYSWKKCDSKTDAKTITCIFSIAAYGNTAIAVGYNGLIRVSRDRGETWNMPDSVTNETLNSIVLLDSNTGVAFGYSGKIIKTTDGGVTWNNIKPLSSAQIVSSVITNSQKILIATADGKIYESTNRGDSWVGIALPVSGLVSYNLSYSFDNKLYLLTKDFLLKSVDDGETWDVLPNPVNKSRNCVFLKDAKVFLREVNYQLKFFVQKMTLM